MSNKIKIINLCPHDIIVYTNTIDGELALSIPTSGIIARVITERKQVGTIKLQGHIVPIMKQISVGVKNLPPKKNNVYYVVSQMVVDESPERDDLLVPGDAKRDDGGFIMGVYDFNISL